MEKIYNYETDSNFKLRVTRIDKKDGKNFFQEHSLVEGHWTTGSGNLKVQPYKYPDWKDEKIIYFVEGEKCADKLISLGVAATTIPGGSNAWKNHYTKYFYNKSVVILPDNDVPGKNFAQKVLSELQKNSIQSKIVTLPNLKHKEDVYEFLELNTIEDLKMLSDKAEWINDVQIKSSTFLQSKVEDDLKLSEAALWGLAGQIVNTIAPQSEASSAALLSQLLCTFGCIIGRSPSFLTEADHQRANIFVLNVGTSSKGRKGTSWGHIEKLYRTLDPDWMKNNVKSGLSSGEGLLWPLKDNNLNDQSDIPKIQKIDKRLLCVETEFSSLLQVMTRAGNTVSSIIRNAWDGKTLSTLTKNPIEVSDPHVSIIGHITKQELLKLLSENDISNGFGNRFLFFLVKRSQLLPEGGNIDPKDFNFMAEELKASIEFAKKCKIMKRTDEAKELWASIYPRLSEGEMGLVGSLNSRAEAQVVKLSLLQALINRENEITAECLQSALDIQEYSKKSLIYIFGNQSGSPKADKIYSYIKDSPRGVSKTDINNFFNRNSSAVNIDGLLSILSDQGLVKSKIVPTDGRSLELWFSTENYELNEISAISNKNLRLNSFNSSSEESNS
jgi:5S rRNA maturation endonuclease (ribonuclease M5)